MADTTSAPSSDLVHEKAFLGKEDADKYYALEKELPWGEFTWIPGTKPLKQLVYFYDAKERATRRNDLVEDMVQLIENKFETKAVITWCNLFRDNKDKIDWHQDQYGMSLFVLSFGASRPVEIRPKKGLFGGGAGGTTQTTLNLEHGDLYHWTHEFDKAHEHCVPPVADAKAAAAGGESSPSSRISILVLAHPKGSNRDPGKFQTKMMDPVYTGQCSACGAFLEEAKVGGVLGLNPTRKCQGCGKKYGYYGPWF